MGYRPPIPFIFCWFVETLYILGNKALSCDTSYKYLSPIGCLLILHKLGFCHEEFFLWSWMYQSCFNHFWVLYYSREIWNYKITLLWYLVVFYFFACTFLIHLECTQYELNISPPRFTHTSSLTGDATFIIYYIPEYI